MGDTTLRFDITGLHCASCVGRAEEALAKVPGARDVRVNLADRSARMSGGDPGAAISALSRAGYEARVTTTLLAIPAMSCASCVARIEAAAKSVPGVLNVSAQLPTQNLLVEILGDPGPVKEALAAAGYPASAPQTDTPPDPARPLLQRFLLAAVLTLPVFVLEMGSHAIPAMHHWIMRSIGTQTSHLIQLALTALVLMGPGAGFFRRGIPGLLRARPDMDALVALGAGAAFGFSAFAVLMPTLLPPSGVYFEAAAVIVTLILLGRWLEARAKGRTGDAVRRLLELRPDTAEVERNGSFAHVPFDEVQVGDVVRVRPGGRFAVDGVVVSGTTHVDEAMLTGEPIPVLKQQGDEVSAGTLTTTGTLTFRATRVGRDTVLARITALTQAAQAARLPVEALVNRITAWFVPVVLLIAAVTFVTWWAVSGLGPAVVAGVSVLIIACPCAMGLATPMSIMVGTGRAAELGVLFHKGAALQQLQNTRVIAFDKTGTLTVGAPVVTDVAGHVDRDILLARAAAVERHSEHPLGRAIVAAAPEVAQDVSDFNATPGHGAQARVGGKHVIVGNQDMLSAHNVPVEPEWTAEGTRWARQGRTCVHIAIDGAHLGVIAISDQIREGSAKVVADLQATGRTVAMISGDSEQTAQYVGSGLGIRDIVAGVRPYGKVAAIAELRAAHGAVAFVGDGINDAPALAASEVGLAVNGASDVAIEAADVVLMSPEPGAVLRAVRISTATLRNIKQNLVWAFGYNVLLIPVAAGVLVPFGGPQLSPALAALAMALSSVFVVTNALRLRKAGTP
ncbi:heavy metal translocating P-type ATPase [uncultured Tateyamaria sp.]|uniref:heavy metal translocating P-type ATPase n=1 Tax=uncultured Tateyamaria sp. TaxID=455651 RepID=UPI00263A3214|nr:heavy metal translocating P-type ATPase [uncultured Tateyamaria sp.]